MNSEITANDARLVLKFTVSNTDDLDEETRELTFKTFGQAIEDGETPLMALALARQILPKE